MYVNDLGDWKKLIRAQNFVHYLLFSLIFLILHSSKNKKQKYMIRFIILKLLIKGIFNLTTV